MKFKYLFLIFLTNISVLVANLPTQTESFRLLKRYQDRFALSERPYDYYRFKGLGGVSPYYTDLFDAFIGECEQREYETNDTHIALYHGRNLMSLMWFDANRAIYNKYQTAQNKYGNPLYQVAGLYQRQKSKCFDQNILDSEEFVFFRDPQQTIGTIEGLPAAKMYLHNPSERHYDNNLRSSGSAMLATSLNPLIGDPYESALWMYRANKSVNNNISLLGDCLKKHGFAEKETEQLIDLYVSNHLHDKPYGYMTQLLIPHEIAVECVYLSKPFGIPYDDEQAAYFKHIGGRALKKDIVQNITALKRNQFAIKNGSYPQARIALASKYFANPNSGIKMYHHCPIEPVSAGEFKKQRSALFKQAHQEPKYNAAAKMFNVLKKWW